MTSFDHIPCCIRFGTLNMHRKELLFSKLNYIFTSSPVCIISSWSQERKIKRARGDRGAREERARSLRGLAS